MEIKAAYGQSGNHARDVFGSLLDGECRLNIGCGGSPMPGWVNVDKHAEGADIAADTLALPFADDTFDVILASHVLEHVEDVMCSVYELHRVLKPGGRLCVIVPYAWSDVGLCNPFHRNYFTAHTFVYFRKDTFDQPGTSGYRANEGKPVADWASVRLVGYSPEAKWAKSPMIDEAMAHYIGVLTEVCVVMQKAQHLGASTFVAQDALSR